MDEVGPNDPCRVRQPAVTVTPVLADAISEAIRSSERFALLEKRPLKTAVEARLESTGEFPPGLNRRAEKVVTINRPTKR